MRERSDLNFHPHHRIKGESSQRNGHINGLLSPDTSVERIRTYLLDPTVYGNGPRRNFFGLASRNYRSPIKFI